MKIMTVVGTRPELIRLSRIIPLLDKYCEHTLVHTGQNYDENLKDVFFEQLKIRQPDYQEDCAGSTPFETIGKVLKRTEYILNREAMKFDRFLVLGDTNSALSAIVAKRYGVPVFHMEAGNRCYDDEVPEELNRRIIDHSSDLWMPYTERSRQNLLREGIPGNKIYVTGNPILEVIQHNYEIIRQSNVLEYLNITPQKYFVVTLHRAENVNDPVRLASRFGALIELALRYPDHQIVVSMHPHTKAKLEGHITKRMEKLGNFIIRDPFNFADFLYLEQNARCVITDSGTVQEECCILGIPNVTLRNTTERPETIECGSNIICGRAWQDLISAVKIATEEDVVWAAPPEYLTTNVSKTVLKIVMGQP